MNKEVLAINELYKSHFGKMVTAMLQFSRDIDLEMAEDLVQDAFYTALSTWKLNGIPENPAGWAYRVSRNNAINALKRKKIFKNPFEEVQLIDGTPEREDDVFDDRKMQLLFACAHPRLTSKMQVVITLKYVANLKAESISRALGMTVDGIDKVLARAKQRIKLENVFLQPPTPQQLKTRLPVVHKIIYLLFNEGYRASSGKDLIRQELCEESLIMTKCLLDNHISNEDTVALYALLLFNAARMDARITATGELSDLEEQDRNVWNKDLIALGNHYLRETQTGHVSNNHSGHASNNHSGKAPNNHSGHASSNHSGQAPNNPSGHVSNYHYEAAIAYLHCIATSFAQTDWTTITQIYVQLLQNNPNPFVELNYAIALYYDKQTAHAFGILHDLQSTFLEQYYLLHATLGKLYLLQGENLKGEEHLKRALSLTHFQAEKDFVRKILLRVGHIRN
jgi:RNA polymerase sigma-70 factor (ECF subfamily)